MAVPSGDERDFEFANEYNSSFGSGLIVPDSGVIGAPVGSPPLKLTT